MKTLFTTNIGRLRILGFLEGLSLLVLVFIAMPLKYLNDDPAMVKALGPIHGALFLLFLFYTLSVSIQERWSFGKMTWKVMISCVIPFASFYINHHILAKLARSKTNGATVLLLLASLMISCSNPPTTHFFKNNMDFPESLDQFKLFVGPMADLKPAQNAQLLELSSTLFTDYSEKQRLLILPPGTKMIARGDKLPDFPEGAILVKTFYYTAKQTGDGKKIVETRILKKNKGQWNVATYVWNEEQTNAFLSYDGAKVPVTIIDAKGNEQDIDYEVPTANMCFDCHKNTKELTPLGPKLRNLNRDISINGITVSQLNYLRDKGLLSIDGHQSIARLPAYTDTSQPIEQRARSYMEVNCAHCHNPQGFAGGYSLNLQYETDFAKTGIKGNKWNIEHRMNMLDMPKLGTTIKDQEGFALVQEYLATLVEPQKK